MSHDNLDPKLLPLALTALGVVYGDIGTSPLYAMRECFYGPHAVAATPGNVLGVLSMILYALLIVISLKYVTIVLRADNRGEGGILALTALLPEQRTRTKGRIPTMVLFGLFGAALLYGDGMITPAITVLSAVEGLSVATPVFDRFVVPITIGILVAVFAIQRHGTDRIGKLFGPIMVIWFVTLAALGLRSLMLWPEVLWAVDPRYAVRFFQEHGSHGFMVLGGVVLVITGGESLYADMGHCGRTPIRVAWFGLVLPALLLNYFGQGALLLLQPEAASNPFFGLSPGWALLPLVALSTAAAIIASQALISGAFSLTRQAVQLGFSPRVAIEHTSSHEIGQVYVPPVNWMLMVSTIAIVIGFQTSASLAAAYGIAVTLTMVMTAVLLHTVALERWKWPAALVFAATGLFLSIDLTFFAANALKIAQGGWLPMAIGAVIFTLMTTWKTGRRLANEWLSARSEPIDTFLDRLESDPPQRVPGTAVFMTAQARGTPPALAQYLRGNRPLPQTVVLLVVKTYPWPYVGPEERVSIKSQGDGVYDVTLYFGFMDETDVPKALALARQDGLPIDLDDITYVLGRETLVSTRSGGMARWREALFVLMARHAARATDYFRLPPERVVELGVRVEI